MSCRNWDHWDKCNSYWGSTEYYFNYQIANFHGAIAVERYLLWTKLKGLFWRLGPIPKYLNTTRV